MGNVEQLPRPQEISLKERFRLHNKMQMELAVKFYGFKDEGKIAEWIGAHGARFRTIAESRDGSEDLIAFYKAAPERALTFAEQILYGKAKKAEAVRE